MGGLGASWGAVARFWYAFWETLGRKWAHHGPSWSQVDNKLRPRRAMISARPGKPLIPPRLLHPMGTYLGSATLYNIIFLFQERNYSGEAQGELGEESDVLCFKREKNKKDEKEYNEHVCSVKLEVWRGSKSKKFVVWRRCITTSLCNNMDLVVLRLICVLLNFRRNFRNAEA